MENVDDIDFDSCPFVGQAATVIDHSTTVTNAKSRMSQPATYTHTERAALSDDQSLSVNVDVNGDGGGILSDPTPPPFLLDLAPAPELVPADAFDDTLDALDAPLTPAGVPSGGDAVSGSASVVSSCSVSLQSWGENNSRTFRRRHRAARQLSLIGRQSCLEEDQLRNIIDAANKGVRSFDRQIYKEGEGGFHYILGKEECPSGWVLSGGTAWVGASSDGAAGGRRASAPGGTALRPLDSLRRRANQVDCMGYEPGTAGTIPVGVDENGDDDVGEDVDDEDFDGFDVACDC